MKAVLGDEPTRDELLVYRNAVYRNLVESAQTLVLAMRRNGMEYMNPDICACMDKIINYSVASNPSFIPDKDVAIAIHQIWTNYVVPTILDDIDPLTMGNAA